MWRSYFTGKGAFETLDGLVANFIGILSSESFCQGEVYRF
jgi:hypothetical protein